MEDMLVIGTQQGVIPGMAILKGAEVNLGVRRWGWVLAALVGTGGLLYGCERLMTAWRNRTALAEIRDQIHAGRHGAAARSLNALLAREPSSDEAAYLLGLCERSRGRTDSADEAWALVPPDSRFAPPAIVGRASLLVDRGRLASAERFLDQALRDPRIDGFDLRRFLAPLYAHEGRLEEARRLVEANWEGLNRNGQGDSDRAIELVRLHIAASLGSASVEAVREFLDRAQRLSPNDDRIWLGKANLAIRQGELDEAARSLDTCLKRRPEDVPVWRARLDWAVAAGRVAETREALKHLPASESSGAQLHRLAAWFAARRGDATSESRALERLIAADPGDGAALDRLAELALREGQPNRAAELRGRKAALDPLKSLYKELFLRNQPLRDAAEMARLAEQLGQWFEAKAFLSLAVAKDPNRDDLRAALARLERVDTAAGGTGQSLAEVIAIELDAAIADPSSPSHPLTGPGRPGHANPVRR